MSSDGEATQLANPEIVIVGAGFSGLGMAIRLKQQGIENFLILERGNDVGGVWRDNTYPGCACDVESMLYSFSFVPHSDWSRRFSGQSEIWEYLRDCVRRFELGPHLRLGQAFESATWDETCGHWLIRTSQGTLRTRMLISGMGAFSEPKLPAFRGLSDFGGRVFHSARWDHGVDLRGKRVAVIGTGASAIQFVPEIQPLVAKLHLFQRSPAWILPRPDRVIDEAARRRYTRFPALMRLQRLNIFARRELTGLGFRHPALMGLMRSLALRHLARSIQDPRLRDALTPRYQIGCKRVLLSNSFYPAVAAANLELVSDPIAALTAGGIRTADGQERALDVIIFGTGFEVTEYRVTGQIRGRNGQSLAEAWQGSPKAHLGTMFAGFPNLFLLLGPNTGLGHSSVVLMIEAQLELVLSALHLLQARGMRQIEPRPEAQAAYIQALDARSRRTVWMSGCRSWYLDATGRNATIWPGSIPAFKRRLLPLREREFELS